jgi:hypothetical protein
LRSHDRIFCHLKERRKTILGVRPERSDKVVHLARSADCLKLSANACNGVWMNALQRIGSRDLPNLLCQIGLPLWAFDLASTRMGVVYKRRPIGSSVNGRKVTAYWPGAKGNPCRHSGIPLVQQLL